MVPNAFTILCWTKIYMVHKKNWVMLKEE